MHAQYQSIYFTFYTQKKCNRLSTDSMITVDSVSTAEGFDQFLEERLDVGDAVDVFIVNAENAKDIAQKGQFYDLSILDNFQSLSWWSMAIPVMARSLYPIYQAENRAELMEGLNSREVKIGDYMIEDFKMFEEFLEKGCYGDNLVMEEAVGFVDYLVSQREELLAQDTSGSLSPFHSTAAPETNAAWKQSILDLMEAGHQIPLEDMNLHFGYWNNTRKLCLAMVDGMSAEDAAEEYNRIQMAELRTYAEKTEGAEADDK